MDQTMGTKRLPGGPCSQSGSSYWLEGWELKRPFMQQRKAMPLSHFFVVITSCIVQLSVREAVVIQVRRRLCKEITQVWQGVKENSTFSHMPRRPSKTGIPKQYALSKRLR